MAYLDTNNNSYPIENQQWTFPQFREWLFFYKALGFTTLPNSAYEATSPSMDYVHNNNNGVIKILNDRKMVEKSVDKSGYQMVFVWDIGEITTITNQYLIQCLILHRSINAGSLLDMYKSVASYANICYTYDKNVVVNIEDAIDEAARYNALKQFYNEISDGMREDGPIINYELIERCGMSDRVEEIYCTAALHQSIFHQRWQMARKCLDLINKRSDDSSKTYANVVLSEDGMALGAAQLLISGNSKRIPIENIYSTWNASKESVFERIQQKFGEKCVLVYITSKKENAAVLEKLNIPIWEIKAHDSIEQLYNALQDVFLR